MPPTRKNHYCKLLESHMSKTLENDPKANPHVARFKPTPAAGVFTKKDIEYLERCQDASRRLAALRELKQNEPPIKRPRETLANTDRFWQQPRTSAVFGGKK